MFQGALTDFEEAKLETVMLHAAIRDHSEVLSLFQIQIYKAWNGVRNADIMDDLMGTSLKIWHKLDDLAAAKDVASAAAAAQATAVVSARKLPWVFWVVHYSEKSLGH